jgi:hypothetical protein
MCVCPCSTKRPFCGGASVPSPPLSSHKNRTTDNMASIPPSRKVKPASPKKAAAKSPGKSKTTIVTFPPPLPSLGQHDEPIIEYSAHARSRMKKFTLTAVHQVENAVMRKEITKTKFFKIFGGRDISEDQVETTIQRGEYYRTKDGRMIFEYGDIVVVMNSTTSKVITCWWSNTSPEDQEKRLERVFNQIEQKWYRDNTQDITEYGEETPPQAAQGGKLSFLQAPEPKLPKVVCLGGSTQPTSSGSNFKPNSRKSKSTATVKPTVGPKKARNPKPALPKTNKPAKPLSSQPLKSSSSLGGQNCGGSR